MSAFQGQHRQPEPGSSCTLVQSRGLGGVRQQGNVPSPLRRGLVDPAGLRAVAFTARNISVPSTNSNVGFLPQLRPSPSAAQASQRGSHRYTVMLRDAVCSQTGVDSPPLHPCRNGGWQHPEKAVTCPHLSPRRAQTWSSKSKGPSGFPVPARPVGGLDLEQAQDYL